MKFVDTSQNLRARLFAVQGLAVLLLSLLGVRLYLLQVVRGSYYAEIAQNQRIRLLPITPRAALSSIATVPALDSRPIYAVILSREDLRKDLGTLVKPLAEGLGLDADLLRERFEEIKSLPSFESVPIKQDATPGDIAWVEARELEFPELRIEQQPQRRYPPNGSLAHVVGYVGEVGPEQLKQPAYREKKLKPAM